MILFMMFALTFFAFGWYKLAFIALLLGFMLKFFEDSFPHS